MITTFANALVKRRTELEVTVFEFPPKTWDEFQQRLGQYKELNISINDIETLIKGLESDDEP